MSLIRVDLTIIFPKGWSLQNYEQLFNIRAHDESILALLVSEDRELLFSSGVDSTVKVWSLRTFSETASFYSLYDVGDIFCLAYSAKRKTVFTGSQNGSLQVCNIAHFSVNIHQLFSVRKA